MCELPETAISAVAQSARTTQRAPTRRLTSLKLCKTGVRSRNREHSVEKENEVLKERVQELGDKLGDGEE